MEGSTNERLDFRKIGYRCKHYRRRCQIRALCCNEIYLCRHCHNEATSMLSDPFDRHELVRYDVKQVVCSICDIEQPVAKVCTNYGVSMGEYFCDICKFYDDDTTKEQFHCNDCGICRIGGRDKFYHCKKCVNYQSSHCSSFPTPPPHSGFKTKNQNFGTGALVDRDFLPRGLDICT